MCYAYAKKDSAASPSFTCAQANREYGVKKKQKEDKALSGAFLHRDIASFEFAFGHNEEIYNVIQNNIENQGKISPHNRKTIAKKLDLI